ncbi:MAG: DNA mismatch repair protein MutS [Betaproteobacteria bacterium]|nr:DNA mismatch repair protein MutS [Betaproteobacteria bacterium]
MSEEFRKAVRDVTPLAEPRRIAPAKDAPPPFPVQSRLDDHAVLAESVTGPLSVEDALGSGEELTYLREGLSRQVLRRLRRGHWVVQDALDLHGMNRVEAALHVPEFLGACVRRGLRCVRIVHGRGHGSKNREPVLKNLLGKWLPRRDEVLAYCQAPAIHGGSGATLVLLKASR